MNVSYSQKIRGLMQLRRVLILVWDSARAWTIASLGLVMIQAFLPLLALYLMKLTVDSVAAGISAPDKVAALHQVFLWVGLTAAVALLTAGCHALSEIIKKNQSHLVTDHVTDLIHRQSAAVDISYYEDSVYHDTLYRAQQNAPYRPNNIVNSLTQLVQNGISLLTLAGLLVYLHWAIALILFIAVFPGVIVKIRYADRRYEWFCRSAAMERRADDYHNMLTNELHAKEVRLFDLGDIFRKRYMDLRQKLRLEQLLLEKSRSVFEFIAQTGTILALFGMLAFIALRTVQGTMTLGDMVMYYGAFQRAQGYLSEILGGMAGLYEDSMFLNHFYDFMDLKPQMAVSSRSISISRPMREGISLEHVSFRYPATNSEILHDISLTIRPGEIVALVGDNGAGKTTLAKLLCRLYDPTDGRVTLDGNDFRDFDLQSLRREISMIFQDYIHYPFSAKENIWVGDVRLNPDDGRIRNAAQQSGADEIIGQLPNGYETILGNRFDGGVELSIGEWQKVALARAFLRNAQLIILDEPTSSMSARVEYEIFEAFRKLLNGRSALLISHRFSTVQMADLICVLNEGKIVEYGSHKELIQQGGYYAHLYEIQSRYYR